MLSHVCEYMETCVDEQPFKLFSSSSFPNDQDFLVSPPKKFSYHGSIWVHIHCFVSSAFGQNGTRVRVGSGYRSGLGGWNGMEWKRGSLFARISLRWEICKRVSPFFQPSLVIIIILFFHWGKIFSAVADEIPHPLLSNPLISSQTFVLISTASPSSSTLFSLKSPLGVGAAICIYRIRELPLLFMRILYTYIYYYYYLVWFDF